MPVEGTCYSDAPGLILYQQGPLSGLAKAASSFKPSMHNRKFSGDPATGSWGAQVRTNKCLVDKRMTDFYSNSICLQFYSLYVSKRQSPHQLNILCIGDLC